MTAHEFHGNTIISLQRSLRGWRRERHRSSDDWNINEECSRRSSGAEPWLGRPLASYGDFVLHRCQHCREARVFVGQKLGRLVKFHHLGDKKRPDVSVTEEAQKTSLLHQKGIIVIAVFIIDHFARRKHWSSTTSGFIFELYFFKLILLHLKDICLQFWFLMFCWLYLVQTKRK